MSCSLHLEKISYTLDLDLKNYENILLMGDFNVEVGDEEMMFFVIHMAYQIW